MIKISTDNNHLAVTFHLFMYNYLYPSYCASLCLMLSVIHYAQGIIGLGLYNHALLFYYGEPQKFSKMLLEISQNFIYYTFHASHYACIMLHMSNINAKLLLLKCSIRVFMIREYVCLILSMHFSAL